MFRIINQCSESFLENFNRNQKETNDCMTKIKSKKYWI